jgi:hypothetical protein
MKNILSMAGLRAGHPGQSVAVFVTLDGRVKPAHGEVGI